jgi:hypothetical protein
MDKTQRTVSTNCFEAPIDEARNSPNPTPTRLIADELSSNTPASVRVSSSRTECAAVAISSSQAIVSQVQSRKTEAVDAHAASSTNSHVLPASAEVSPVTAPTAAHTASRVRCDAVRWGAVLDIPITVRRTHNQWASCSERLLERLEFIFSEETTEGNLDLSGVGFLSASTIGVIVQLSDQFRRQDRALNIVLPSAAARRVFVWSAQKGCEMKGCRFFVSAGH